MQAPRMEVRRVHTPPTNKTWWINDFTWQRVQEAVGRSGNMCCGICGHVSESRNDHRRHCYGHYAVCICPCGKSSFHKETIIKHQQAAWRARKAGAKNKERCTSRVMYQVDQDSFDQWQNHTGMYSMQYPWSTHQVRVSQVRAPGTSCQHATSTCTTSRDQLQKDVQRLASTMNQHREETAQLELQMCRLTERLATFSQDQ